MNQNLFQELNPLDNEFWKENPEGKFKQIVKLGYASILASFFAALMAGYFVILIWDFFPFSYFGIYSNSYYFSVYSIPIFNGLFLVYAFSNKELTTFHKIFSFIFILSFLAEIPHYIFIFEYTDGYGFIIIIGILPEICYRVIISILTIFVFLGKPSNLIPSIAKLFVFFSIISFLFNIIGRWLFLNESFEFFRFTGSFALLFFSYSLFSICHYRINIEPWSEEKIASSASSSAPEQQSSSLSNESIAKLKSLSELRDSGILSNDEFEDQKAKIMSETNSPSTYVGNGEPIDDTFRILIYVVSFIIPIVGIIVGILYTMKPDNPSQEFGKTCLKIAIASIVIGFLIGIIFSLVLVSTY